MNLKKIDKNITIAMYEGVYLICNSYKPRHYYYMGFTNEKNEFTLTTPYGMGTTPTDFKNMIDADGYDGIDELNNKIRLLETKKRKKQSVKDFIKTGKNLIALYTEINSETNGNAETITYELLGTLGDIADELEQHGTSETNENNLQDISEEKLIEKLNSLSDKITADKNSKVCFIKNTGEEEIVQVKNNSETMDGLYKHWEKQDGTSGYWLIGNILINSFTMTYDKLKLFDPVVSIDYTNTLTKQNINIEKQSFEAIASNLLKNRLINMDSRQLENLLNDIWVDGSTHIDFINAETDLLKDGFFIDEETGKVLSNNVFENFETSPEEVRKAIKLFNDLIKNRGTAIPNDCSLFRFMLWSPFGFCLKQIGFIDDLYSMVLWGVTDTNKTGSSVMFSYLYTDKKTTLQKANTQSAIGTRLGENTFPLILDEAKDNLINPNDEEFNKNIVTDITGRAVKDRTNNNLMQNFPALRMTIRTLNQDIEYKGEFLKRHKVLYYDASMQVTDEAKKEFNKKYKPHSPNTILRQLKHLGKAFADRFIIYLEKQSDELYDLEKLTIRILEDIEKESGIKFNMNVKVIQKLTNQSNDEESIIKKGLNKMFINEVKVPYGRNKYMEPDFINACDMGVINWLDYQPNNKLFIIKIDAFEKTISNIVGQHIPIAETMKLLKIRYDDNNGKKIKFKGNAQKCIKLNTYNLTYKLFGINIYTYDELEELQADETEKEQREVEADKILNAKPI